MELSKYICHTMRIALIVLCAYATSAAAALNVADTVPSFSFPSLDGKTVTQAQITAASAAVVYVFSTKCKTCEAGLQQLQKVVQGGKDAGLVVLGLSKQGADETKAYTGALNLRFPILTGEGGGFDQFDRHIYPVTYLFGPEGRVTRVMQGNDASVAALLASLGEQALERKNAGAAEQIYTELAAQGDNTGTAQAGKAYSLLNAGKLAEAEATFQSLAKDPKREIAVKGQEGLAETYLQQGQLAKAAQSADQALQIADNRSVPHLVKGRVAYLQGNKSDAEKEIALASREQVVSDFGWQKAQAHYAEGNLQRTKKQPRAALAAYKKAVAENPHYAEALSNEGVTLQELGDPEAALKSFTQAKQRSGSDRMVDSLIRQAQAAIKQKQDLEKQRYIDSMVKDLAQRYKERKAEQGGTPQDDWTSPALAISILGFQNRAGEDLMGRAGIESVLQDELTHQLQSANYTVVEREVLDKLLGELNLGSSAIADPDASLRLGKVLASRLIATGTLTQMGAREQTVSLRLVDTETTNIVLPLSEKQPGGIDPVAVATKFSKAIDTTVRERYPLQGRIAEVDGDTVIINLGKKHNVAPGMVFEVLGEGKPVELNGRVLGARQTKLGELRVTESQDSMSFTSPLGSAGDWEKNQKVKLKSGAAP